MQEQIMLFFQRIATGFLDVMAEGITIFGEETLLIVFVLLIFWCIDKKKGLVISTSLLASEVAMCTLKAIVRAPRPFQVLESVQGKRVETATGYSFPSGHTTGASSVYSSIAFNFRKKWLSVVCAVIIVLVGVSRLYLGVHWPLDVACGLILGITITVLLTGILEKFFSDEHKTMVFSACSGSIALVAGLVMGLLVTTGTIDAMAFTDFTKMLGLTGGAFLGFLLEEKYTKFSVEGTLVQKGLRMVLGIGFLVLIKSGLKAVFPTMVVFDCIRYAVTGFWAFGLFPMIGAKAKLFASEA